MFTKMLQPEFDPHTSVYADEPIDFTLPPSDDSPAGDCEILKWQAQSITIRANANKECVLVLADGYYPGWEATIDGAPAKIFPAYHLFRGVHLPPGQHSVEFHYRPASFRYGLIISFLGLAASGICALIAMRKSRSSW